MSDTAAATTTTTTNNSPPPPPATAATTETVNPGSWMAGFNDDAKGYVGLKGFKDPAMLLDSYRSLEKFHGVPPDKLVKLPEKGFWDEKGLMTPEGRAVYERLGAPKEAKGYGLDKFVPKENGDAKLMEHFANIFHEAGVPQKVAEKIAGSWNDYQAKVMQAMKEAQTAKTNDATQALKKEWGAAYEQNVKIADEGVRRLQLSTQDVQAMGQLLGTDGAMKLLKKLGESVGEAAFVTGANPNKVMEPATAKARIDELKKDRQWFDRLMKGGVDEKAEWNRLHAMATAGL